MKYFWNISKISVQDHQHFIFLDSVSRNLYFRFFCGFLGHSRKKDKFLWAVKFWIFPRVPLKITKRHSFAEFDLQKIFLVDFLRTVKVIAIFLDILKIRLWAEYFENFELGPSYAMFFYSVQRFSYEFLRNFPKKLNFLYSIFDFFSSSFENYQNRFLID